MYLCYLKEELHLIPSQPIPPYLLYWVLFRQHAHLPSSDPLFYCHTPSLPLHPPKRLREQGTLFLLGKNGNSKSKENIIDTKSSISYIVCWRLNSKLSAVILQTYITELLSYKYSSQTSPRDCLQYTSRNSKSTVLYINVTE